MRDLRREEDARGVARAADELAAALLPRTLERLRAHTSVTRETTRRLARPGVLDDARATAVLLERVDGDERVIDRLGWGVALLAAAGGTDVLLERRRADALEVVVELVADALGRSIAPDAGRLPRLRAAGGAWQVPFVVGVLALRASRTLDPHEPVRWSFVRERERGRLAFRGGASIDDVAGLVTGLERADASARHERPVVPWTAVVLPLAAFG